MHSFMTIYKKMFTWHNHRDFVISEFPNYVCNKAIYGLKQAPRAWFNRLSESLLDFGFVQSMVNASLFLFHRRAVHLFILGMLMIF